MTRKHSLDPTVAYAVHLLKDEYLPHLLSCLKKLSLEQIWWRPNPASNSVGNLALHLAGNVRQWIISGLGGETDFRERDIEFSECRNIPRRLLASGLQSTVQKACRVMRGLTTNDLRKIHAIQKFRVSGLEAVFHVTEHFSHHTGQIIMITKMLSGNDLKFTRLPGDKKTRSGK